MKRWVISTESLYHGKIDTKICGYLDIEPFSFFKTKFEWEGLEKTEGRRLAQASPLMPSLTSDWRPVFTNLIVLEKWSETRSIVSCLPSLSVSILVLVDVQWEVTVNIQFDLKPAVSILVLVDVQWEVRTLCPLGNHVPVSILVLVDVQWEVCRTRLSDQFPDVSILVLVDVQWEDLCRISLTLHYEFQSLFWWMFSERQPAIVALPSLVQFQSLFWWMFSERGMWWISSTWQRIGFNPCFGGCSVRGRSWMFPITSYSCFNPCFGGCSVRGKATPISIYQTTLVSILVLVDVQWEGGYCV